MTWQCKNMIECLLSWFRVCTKVQRYYCRIVDFCVVFSTATGHIFDLDLCCRLFAPKYDIPLVAAISHHSSTIILPFHIEHEHFLRSGSITEGELMPNTVHYLVWPDWAPKSLIKLESALKIISGQPGIQEEAWLFWLPKKDRNLQHGSKCLSLWLRRLRMF